MIDKEPIRVFTCFAGYGTDIFALKSLGIEHDLIGYSEIDKYAIQCFQQNHCKESDFNTPNGWKRELLPKNYGDISKITWATVPDFDLLTGGFPCQDVSNAGKQDLNKGRSVLGFELTKALIAKQPKYFMFENVKGILSKKFEPFLTELLKQWRTAGYVVVYKKLNTREHGIPQNRERVFFVGIRKDFKYFDFEWPEPTELKLKLKDILEYGIVNKDYSYCIDANYWKGTNYKQYFLKSRRQIVFNLPNNTIKGFQEATNGDGVRLQYPKSKTARGRVIKNIAQTLQANSVNGVIQNNQIRKLTPKECFRLQGFLEDEVNLEGLSDTQKYKLAGNGQSVNVVKLIFSELLRGRDD